MTTWTTLTSPDGRWAEVESQPDGTFVSAYLGVGDARMGVTSDESLVDCWLFDADC